MIRTARSGSLKVGVRSGATHEKPQVDPDARSSSCESSSVLRGAAVSKTGTRHCRAGSATRAISCVAPGGQVGMSRVRQDRRTERRTRSAKSHGCVTGSTLRGSNMSECFPTGVPAELPGTVTLSSSAARYPMAMARSAGESRSRQPEHPGQNPGHGHRPALPLYRPRSRSPGRPRRAGHVPQRGQK